MSDTDTVAAAIPLKWAQRKDRVFLTSPYLTSVSFASESPENQDVITGLRFVSPSGTVRELPLFSKIQKPESEASSKTNKTLVLFKTEPGSWPKLTSTGTSQVESSTFFKISCDWDRWEPESDSDDGEAMDFPGNMNGMMDFSGGNMDFGQDFGQEEEEECEEGESNDDECNDENCGKEECETCAGASSSSSQ